MSEHQDDPFDLELSNLARVDLDPIVVRSTRGAALRLLQASGNLEAHPRSRPARYVPALLYVLSAAQLVWAATRLLVWSH